METNKDNPQKNNNIQTSVQKYEDEWCQLFSTLKIFELKQRALQGNLRASRFRSLCWFLLLEVLPEDSSKWLSYLSELRVDYGKMRDKLSCDPWSNKSVNDDPLSQNDNSLWNKHFCDEELRSVIRQDVVRTFPGVDFFRKPVIQDVMVSILFIYAREYPIMCYRQGMHELLAPILFVLHCDHQAMLHTDEQSLLEENIKCVLNPNYLEEDGYHLFVALMSAMSSCYHINNVAPTATGYFPVSITSLDSPTDSKESENEVVTQLNLIRDHLLQSVDPELCEHLKNLDITLPLFGIRWLRLLFGREFPLQDLLVLWDAIFSQGKEFKFVHYVVVAMLVTIRKQLLEGDYTSCLMHLMRYPTNVDVMYVIQYALHLQSPKEYRKPSTKTHLVTFETAHKKQETYQSEKHVTAPVINKPVTTTNTKQISKPVVNKVANSKQDFIEAETFHVLPSESSERLAAELKHARAIMALSRLKLLQYHKVLLKAVPNTESAREAHLALDGIQELCNLLTSRYFSQQSLTEVEHAVEAGEVRPTDLNLHLSPPTKHIPKMKEEEMKLFACTEIAPVNPGSETGSGFGLPMTDPTHTT